MLYLYRNVTVNAKLYPLDEKGHFYYNYSNLEYEYVGGNSVGNKLTVDNDFFAFSYLNEKVGDRVDISTKKVTQSKVIFTQVSTYF
jgi:hypothetical protein